MAGLEDSRASSVSTTAEGPYDEDEDEDPSRPRTKSQVVDLEYITSFISRILGSGGKSRSQGGAVLRRGGPDDSDSEDDNGDSDDDDAARRGGSDDDGASDDDDGHGNVENDDGDLEADMAEIMREEDVIARRLPRNMGKMSDADWKFPMEDVALQEVLATPGAFSKIHRATYQGETVCVKEVKIEDEVYAITEITLLKNLAHPHVLRLVGSTLDRVGDHTVIIAVMEFMAGGSLADVVAEDSESGALAFGWPQRLRCALQVAGAVEYLHMSGVMHRDVKPDNVLLSGRGDDVVAKLGDFGMARGVYSKAELQSPDEAPPSLFALNGRSKATRAQTILGTDEYMSPEMILNIHYTTSVDVYSFGCLLIELVTGKAMGKAGFLERTPQTEFDIDEAEIREAAIRGGFLSLLELAVHCVAYEPEGRLTPAEAVAWLDELSQDVQSGTALELVEDEDDKAHAAKANRRYSTRSNTSRKSLAAADTPRAPLFASRSDITDHKPQLRDAPRASKPPKGCCCVVQ